MDSKIGTKIREARRMKGYSQEELAESSGVSLRTIQRVENNQSEPRGKTLQLLCESMEINVEDILDYGKKYNGDFIAIFHLSVLAFIAFPLGNIIVPLLLWLYKRSKIIGLDKIAKKVFIIQIVWTMLLYGIFLYAVIAWDSYLLVYCYYGLMGVNIILSITLAIVDRNRMIQSSRLSNTYETNRLK